jgi:60S ribosome subunit biogenesis protein NIP7
LTHSKALQELQTVLEKFVAFIGKSVKALFERDDEAYCFRLHKNRVYYVSERLMKRATNVSSPSD